MNLLSKNLASLLCLTLNACVSSDAVGTLSRVDLQRQYPAFRTSSEAIDNVESLKQLLIRDKNVHLKVFFATWCHDSEREIPRLFALIDQLAEVPLPLELIALDHDKKDPKGEVISFGIQRTPTIVVLRDNHEIGRIIERPQSSLSQALIAILQSAMPR